MFEGNIMELIVIIGLLLLMCFIAEQRGRAKTIADYNYRNNSLLKYMEGHDGVIEVYKNYISKIENDELRQICTECYILTIIYMFQTTTIDNEVESSKPQIWKLTVESFKQIISAQNNGTIENTLDIHINDNKFCITQIKGCIDMINHIQEKNTLNEKK